MTCCILMTQVADLINGSLLPYSLHLTVFMDVTDGGPTVPQNDIDSAFAPGVGEAYLFPFAVLG